MLNKEEFCCSDMMFALTRKSVEGGYGLFLYDPKRRAYGIAINGNPENQYFLSYCPFCGKRYPLDLADEYFDAIRDPITGKICDPLPEEFLTDEWWKKRGL
jgi:hypothetical protein